MCFEVNFVLVDIALVFSLMLNLFEAILSFALLLILPDLKFTKFSLLVFFMMSCRGKSKNDFSKLVGKILSVIKGRFHELCSQNFSTRYVFPVFLQLNEFFYSQYILVESK